MFSFLGQKIWLIKDFISDTKRKIIYKSEVWKPIYSHRELQHRFEDYEESEETDLEDSSERIDLRPSLLVRVSQLSSFFVFWLYDASNPDSTYSESMVKFDIEPKTMQEIPHFNKKARIIPIVWAHLYCE